MDKKLITGALALLIIQIALLAFDVNFDLAGHDSREKSHAKDIGVVTIKKQNVKKRSQGSVVWEDSERGSRLKSNDSILTLENSSAQIELSNDIKIDLQENTLIVLEPQKDQNTDSFRIRFSRGHVRSQTSNQKLELKSETWDIAAAPGSTISLKGLEGDRLEVEISSGSAQLKNSEHPNSIQQISTGSRLTLADSNIEKTEKISESLNLLMKPEMRVYTHSFPVQHFVHWEGSAQRLRIVHPDQKIQYISVNKNENSKVLTLHEGTHYLSLENENSVSKEITFRILEAPKIRYTSPLPRDRYLKGDRILFSWLPIENSIQYELELTNQATERDVLISKKTLIQSDVQVEGSIQMRVFGEDDLGFRIPPHYSQALFILQEALSPPQLHNPEIRSPASPVSSPPLPPLLPPPSPPPLPPPLPPDRPVKKEHRDNEVQLIPRSPGGLPLALLRLFFNFAHAAETTPQKHVTLSWYAVPGADFYNVEISSDPGFLQPEVTEKVDKEIFMWSNFSNKIYYWRVAAGSNSGRMGLFSEMAKLDLTNVDSRESGEIAPGVKLVTPKEVQIKPLTKIPEEAIAAAKLAESELMESKQKSQDDKAARAEQPSTWAFSTDLNLHYLNYSLDKNFSATLSGFANFSFGADATLTKGNKDKYIFTAGLTQAEWKPEDPSTLPYQEELSTTAYAFRALYEQADSEISYGLHVESQPLLHRVGLEQLQKTDVLIYGGALGYNTAVADDITFRSVGSLLTGSSVSAVMGHNSIHYHFGSKGWSPYLGGDFNFKLFFGSDSLSGFYLTTGLHLGLNW